jgi:hypothetical protein
MASKLLQLDAPIRHALQRQLVPLPGLHPHLAVLIQKHGGELLNGLQLLMAFASSSCSRVPIAIDFRFVPESSCPQIYLEQITGTDLSGNVWNQPCVSVTVG